MKREEYTEWFLNNFDKLATKNKAIAISWLEQSAEEFGLYKEICCSTKCMYDLSTNEDHDGRFLHALDIALSEWDM